LAIAEKEAKELDMQSFSFTDADGRTHFNRSKRTQADRKHAEITAENEKISEAERLVMKANAQIEELKTRITR
jgi:hypothetical protein